MTSPPLGPPAPDLQDLLRGVSRSFYLSIRLLPGPLRRPIGLAYLLARASDTIADTAELPADRRAEALDGLTAAIEGSGAPDVAQAFAAHQQAGEERRLIEQLPVCLAALERLEPPDREAIRAVLRQITRGQQLDVQRFGDRSSCCALADASELETYTYLVAGSVGEFWTDLCALHLPEFADLPLARMRELGRSYGSGLQLVNILRDVREDLAIGRCYLPADELAAHGLSPEGAVNAPERLAPVWRSWLARARMLLNDGLLYCEAVAPRRVRAASALPALLGARTLALLEAAGPQASQGRVKVPRSEVRRIGLRLLMTLAARRPLRSHYESLAGGWDNRAR